MGRYCSFKEIELRDAKRGKAQSDVRHQEAKEILAAIPKNAYVIALDERGAMKTTVEFARVCEKIEMQMTNHLCFIIGGPDGLDEAVKNKANLLLALSPFTFTTNLQERFFMNSCIECIAVQTSLSSNMMAVSVLDA